jgi:acetolactate synthase-1/3 small subunit
VEVSPTYAIVTKDGMTEEILSLFNSLMQWDCVLQYVRSGAIAITKNKRELLDEYLAERKERYEA